MNKCSLLPESTIRGTLMITAKSTPIPTYTGTYNVTPAQSQQTLETNGKKMVEDVIVEPIPSQYIIPSGTLEVTENGQQSVREYENVNVNVPTPAGEKTINVTQNGTMTEDVTDYATAKVVTNVPASEVDTGTKNISANGTHNVVGYASAAVNVPNSYSQSDEGKVVQSGTLVSQSSQTITENGTYDTTLKNEVVVDVQSGGDSRIPIMGSEYQVEDSAANAETIRLFNNVLKFGLTRTAGSSLKVKVARDNFPEGTYDIDIKGTHVRLGQQDYYQMSGGIVPIRKITCDDDPNAVMEFTATANQTFRQCTLLEEIRPRLSFESMTGNYYLTWYNNGGQSLKYVRCVPNTLSYNFGFDNSSLLTDDSIVSAANAIKEGTTGTLKFHATPKAKCDSIMGTVSTVTEGGETYSLFTADAQGATSLASFITGTKGWTLA